MTEYFSDKVQASKPRTNEEITPDVWRGIVGTIDSLLDQGALGHAFPILCEEGPGIIGSDHFKLENVLSGEIPDLTWPLSTSNQPGTLVTLDLIQFFHKYVAAPKQLTYHEYLKHHHLGFDEDVGRRDFQQRINLMFARNGIAYELNCHGRIERIAGPIIRDALGEANFSTGESTLDAMLKGACTKFLDPDPKIRQESLEKLWDAWERLKTLKTNDKKDGVRELLDSATHEPEFLEVLEGESRALTRIGNNFQIRHSEKNQTPLESSHHVDYLFHRMFSMIYLLLRSR